MDIPPPPIEPFVSEPQEPLEDNGPDPFDQASYLFWNHDELVEDLIETKKVLAERKRKLTDTQAKNSQLRSQNDEYRKIIIDLQNKLLGREGDYAKEYVKEYMRELEEKYLSETRPFINLAANEEQLIQNIKDIVLSSNKDMYQHFMANTFDKIILKYRQVFIDRVNHYLDSNGLEKDLENFVKKRLTLIMGRYKTADLKGLIHFIIDDVAKRANIELSKEIMNEMSEMQTIQVQTFQECLEKIQNKEKTYIAQSLEKVKMLENKE